MNKQLMLKTSVRRKRYCYYKDEYGHKYYTYFSTQVFWTYIVNTAKVMKSKAKNFVIRYLRRHRSTFRSQPQLATAVAIVIIIILTF